MGYLREWVERYRDAEGNLEGGEEVVDGETLTREEEKMIGGVRGDMDGDQEMEDVDMDDESSETMDEKENQVMSGTDDEDEEDLEMGFDMDVIICRGTLE